MNQPVTKKGNVHCKTCQCTVYLFRVTFINQYPDTRPAWERELDKSLSDVRDWLKKASKE